MQGHLFDYLIRIILIFLTPEVNSENTNQWLGTKQLNENYVMFWKRDDLKEELVIRVEVKTRGWVGFGFSMHGSMQRSDLIIGWVTDEGKTYFHDRWTDRKEMPVIDKSQDWLLISGLQNSSHTVLQFKRPYKTCDTLEDVEVLETEHQNIIWSYSDTDPMNDQNIHKHDNKGIEHLRLLDPVVITEPQEDDLEVYDLTVENIEVPVKPLSFFCKLFKLPFPEPRHVVKCGQHSDPPEMRRFVYHTAIFSIDPLYPTIMDRYVGKVYNCDDLPDIFQNRTNWSIHTVCTKVETESLYHAPPDAGIKVADSPQTTYFMGQIHIENHHGEVGQVLNQSMRFWHTGRLRAHDLDIFDTGLSLGNGNTGLGLMIPPREPRFVMRSVANTYCFERRMDKNGINIDSIRIHTHIHGTEVYVKHIRGDKELEPLLSYVYYDFRYQVFHKLNKQVKILQGDLIMVVCVYNTTNESQMTMGMEVCAMNLIFWPPFQKNNHTFYGENIDQYKNVRFDENNFVLAQTYDTVLKVANLEEIEGYYDSFTPIVRRPTQYNGTTLQDYLKHKKEWIPTLEMEAIFYNSPQYMICTEGNSKLKPRLDNTFIEMPTNYTPYEEKYKQCQTNSVVKH